MRWGAGENVVVESQDQLNFRFTVLTRRLLVAYYNYNIAPCRSILFPPEKFPPIATLSVYFLPPSFPL